MLHQIFSTAYMLLVAYSLVKLPKWYFEDRPTQRSIYLQDWQTTATSCLALLVILRAIEGVLA